MRQRSNIEIRTLMMPPEVAAPYFEDIDADIASLASVAADLADRQREVESQMQAKLDAQVTLKAVTDALDLPFNELGNGWREAAPKILARIETLVDEADRGFRERDEARADRQQLRDALKEALALIEDAFYPGPRESTADGIAVIENVRAALAASAETEKEPTTDDFWTCRCGDPHCAHAEPAEPVCTCTLACEPRGITDEQVCRERLSAYDAGQSE
jgi:hypothetical protein